MRRIEHIEDLGVQDTDGAPTETVARSRVWPEYRAHICPVALLGSDMVAFLVSMFLAFSLSGALGRSPYGSAPTTT